jgi:glycosyltransferase involved in cell wall biosynthesis
MLFNLFPKAPAISYAITVCNEAPEVDNLLRTLIRLIDRNDEIIVLQDITHKDASVSAVLEIYKKKIVVIQACLNNDFATFKNIFLTVAKGDYLFQIDADEMPKTSLIKKIKSALRLAKDYDCFRLPRINIVNGYTQADAKKWKWMVNEKNYINYPDYQARIFKLNGQIKWKYKVHEELSGFKRFFMLQAVDEDFCLVHIKGIEKQKDQNAFYETIT